jgi:hypothetical protein
MARFMDEDFLLSDRGFQPEAFGEVRRRIVLPSRAVAFEADGLVEGDDPRVEPLDYRAEREKVVTAFPYVGYFRP